MIEKYDYYKVIKKDVYNYIINEEIYLKDFSNRKELEEYLKDVLWNDDTVTGNASGSYTHSAYQAEEYIAHNWDLLAEALENFCSDENSIKKGAEWCDVIIRCYLLNEVIVAVLDKMESDKSL